MFQINFYAGLSFACVTSLLSFSLHQTPVQAGTLIFKLPKVQPLEYPVGREKRCGYKSQFVFKLPSSGLPGNREPLALRCGEIPLIPLTALIPKTNIGLTATKQPTFFFYVPSTSAQVGEFRLLTRDNQQIYQTKIPISGTPGVVSFHFPVGPDAPVLEVDRPYRWIFELLVDLEDRSGNPFVIGWIQRVEPGPDLTRRLTKLSPRDRAVLYADAGIWHDALKTLVELRCARPTDAKLATDWQALLQAVELPKISKVSLSNCTQPK